MPDTTTAVARLHTALDPWTPGAAEHTVTLTRADAVALLAHIADLCDDHAKCSLCGTTLCETCGLGEPAGCSDRHSFEDHCQGCAGECHTCCLEVAEDRKAEAYAEATGGRY